MDNFDIAFCSVIDSEGGFTDDPNDAGNYTIDGKLEGTKYGISAKAYAHKLDVKIKDITREMAKEIYRNDYWNPCCCDDLPFPLCAYVFDCAVNQGIKTAITLLQEFCGTTVDGVIGKKTITAANATKKPHYEYLSLRAIKYSKTKGFDLYGKGWYNRLWKVGLYLNK